MDRQLLFLINCFFIFLAIYAGINFYPQSVHATIPSESAPYKKGSFFSNDNAVFMLNRVICLDKNEEITKVRIYEYNDEAQLIKDTIYGNLTGNGKYPVLIQEDGTLVENGVEKYSIQYEYSSEEPYLLLQEIEDNGHRTLHFYDENFQEILQEKYAGNSEVPYEQLILPQAEIHSSDDPLDIQVDIQGVNTTLNNARGAPLSIQYIDGNEETFRYHLDGSLSEHYWQTSTERSSNERLNLKTAVKGDKVMQSFESSTAVFRLNPAIPYKKIQEPQNEFVAQTLVCKPLVNENLSKEERVESRDEMKTTVNNSSTWSFYNAVNHLCRSIYSTINSTINHLKHKEKDLFQIEGEVEKWFIDNFGKSFLFFNGFYQDSSITGVYGRGEVSDKVRITAINGILTVKEDCLFNINMLSEYHGGVNIHYVFHPTEGWTWDIVRATLSKFGYSPQTKMLADLWKKLIQEMGGVKGKGVIIHYAHSLGGTNTVQAKSYMTPDELKMIRVITIGSATMVPNEDFHSAINYVSKRDGVTKLNFGYIKALFGYTDNVIFLGSHWGYPIVDHLITNETYRTLIEDLGEEFINTYGKIELVTPEEKFIDST